MTPTERLALLRTMDHLIALLDNPCARVSAAELKQSRHALDDEAFREAAGPIQSTIGGVGDALGLLLVDPSSAEQPPDDDEFFRGVWWVEEAPGILRPATGSECAAEIRRLRSERQEVDAAVSERRWRCKCGCEWPLTADQVAALPAVPRCPLCTLNRLPIVAISDELLSDPQALSKILGDRLDEGAIILQREKP